MYTHYIPINDIISNLNMNNRKNRAISEWWLVGNKSIDSDIMFKLFSDVKLR